MKLTEPMRRGLAKFAERESWHWFEGRRLAHPWVLDALFKRELIEIYNVIFDGDDRELWRLTDAGRRALDGVSDER